MAPSAMETPSIVEAKEVANNQLPIPGPTRKRLEKAGIDLSKGYPAIPPPFYLQDLDEVARNKPREFIDAGTRADPEKKALFGAATKVIQCTNHIGTEIVGLQLKDLTDKQKDELALLIAERGVVFFRDQDLSPQAQVALGQYWGELYVRIIYSLLHSASRPLTLC